MNPFFYDNKKTEIELKDIVMQERTNELFAWYQKKQNQTDTPKVISGDASARKYYRTKFGILVDSPTDSQKNKEFANYSPLLRSVDLLAPQIYQEDLTQGFFLVEDFGDETFSKGLEAIDNDLSLSATKKNVAIKELYEKAIAQLPKFYAIRKDELQFLDYAFLRKEFVIFTKWCLADALKVNDNNLETPEQCAIKPLKVFLAYLEQFLPAAPRVAMHRDYHSRNIMILNTQKLALVDYQDLCNGFLGYDLASLLYDCYRKITPTLREELIAKAYDEYINAKDFSDITFEDFKKLVTFWAIQRLVKCLGIFYRLSIRDNKHQYLKSIPTVCEYLKDLLPKVAELSEFSDYMLSFVIPNVMLELQGK